MEGSEGGNGMEIQPLPVLGHEGRNPPSWPCWILFPSKGPLAPAISLARVLIAPAVPQPHARSKHIAAAALEQRQRASRGPGSLILPASTSPASPGDHRTITPM